MRLYLVGVLAAIVWPFVRASNRDDHVARLASGFIRLQSHSGRLIAVGRRSNV